MRKLNNITGKKFGRLTVKERDFSAPSRNTRWICVCDCGTEKSILGYNIISGHTQSCGCFRKERTSEVNGTHHGSGTPEYIIWSRMKQRCNDKSHKDFHNYGGRGISVCKEWSDFAIFISDMGKRTTKKHTIDRIDNSKGYSPDNCRWATRKEQNRNTRANVVLTYNGESHCIGEWAEILGVRQSRISSRIRQGWSHKDALAKPKQSNQFAAST